MTDSETRAVVEPPREGTRFADPTQDEAARLIELVEEITARIRDGRTMGLGDRSVVYGIRAQFMDRWLDEWCASIEPEPLSEELIERTEKRRTAVQELMLENARLSSALSAAQQDSERMVRLSTWANGDITICPPGFHGGDPLHWLVAFEDDARSDGYGRQCDEYEAPTLGEAIDKAITASRPPSTDGPRT